MKPTGRKPRVRQRQQHLDLLSHSPSESHTHTHTSYPFPSNPRAAHFPPPSPTNYRPSIDAHLKQSRHRRARALCYYNTPPWSRETPCALSDFLHAAEYNTVLSASRSPATPPSLPPPPLPIWLAGSQHRVTPRARGPLKGLRRINEFRSV